MKARPGCVRIRLLRGDGTSCLLVRSIIESAFETIFHPPILFDAKLSDGSVNEIACQGDRVDGFFEGVHPHLMVLELVFPAGDLLKVELEQLLRLAPRPVWLPDQNFFETIAETHCDSK
jgi:hypothetical protein